MSKIENYFFKIIESFIMACSPYSSYLFYNEEQYNLFIATIEINQDRIKFSDLVEIGEQFDERGPVSPFIIRKMIRRAQREKHIIYNKQKKEYEYKGPQYATLVRVDGL